MQRQALTVEHQKTRQGVEVVAQTEYPWLSQPQDPRQKYVHALEQQLGGLAQAPLARMLIAGAAEGLHRFYARQQGAARPGATPAVKPPARPKARLATTASGAAAPAASGSASAGNGPVKDPLTPEGRHSFFERETRKAMSHAGTY